MYDGIKIAFGPSAAQTAPLKSPADDIITDRGNLMKKLAEYYQELHYRENFVTDTAFYVVIRATRGSSHLQGKVIPSFLSHFKTLCVGSVLGIEPPALQSSALPTELILPG